MEDYLSIFRVHTWTRHGKLGGVRLLQFFDTSLRCWDMTEDDLYIFWVHTWTRHGKLGGVSLLQFFNTSLPCRDMTEDDLYIFWVRIWTRHGKLGGVSLLRFFDMSLRCRDIAVISLPQFGSRQNLTPKICPLCIVGYPPNLTQNFVNLIQWVRQI